MCVCLRAFVGAAGGRRCDAVAQLDLTNHTGGRPIPFAATRANLGGRAWPDRVVARKIIRRTDQSVRIRVLSYHRTNTSTSRHGAR